MSQHSTGQMGVRAAPVRSRRGFYGLLGANALSLSGTRLSMIALPWFVVTSTGSAMHTGLAAFAQMAPYVVAKALAGPVVDRLGPRRVIIGSELAAAVAIGLIPVLHFLGLLPFGALLVMVALVGVTSGPADGAKQALVPLVAARARVPLERVTGLLGSIERLASTAGAAGAGVVVALVGAVPALAINAATFIGAVVLIALTIPRVESDDGDNDADQHPGSYRDRLKAGAVFIWRDKLLRAIYTMTATTNLLDAAMFSVVLPVWAYQTGAGPEAVGLLGGVLGGAAVLASILASAIGHRMPRRLTYLVAFMIGGAPRFVILAFDLPMTAFIAVYLVSGFAVGFLNPIIGAVIYSRIPPNLVGRVTALGSSAAWAGIPFGGLVGGALLAGVALSPALLIMGAAYFLTTTLPALQPAWKQMDSPRSHLAEEAAPPEPERQHAPQ